LLARQADRLRHVRESAIAIVAPHRIRISGGREEQARLITKANRFWSIRDSRNVQIQVPIMIEVDEGRAQIETVLRSVSVLNPTPHRQVFIGDSGSCCDVLK